MYYLGRVPEKWRSKTKTIKITVEPWDFVQLWFKTYGSKYAYKKIPKKFSPAASNRF